MSIVIYTPYIQYINMTNNTSKTLRLNRTRARIIKLCIENYEEVAKLNFITNDYAEMLKIKSLCECVVCDEQHGNNKSHLANSIDKKVIV